MIHNFICTARDPWKPGDSRGVHPDAQEVRGSQQNGWPGGDIVAYECPHCKQRFDVELPQ